MRSTAASRTSLGPGGNASLAPVRRSQTRRIATDCQREEQQPELSATLELAIKPLLVLSRRRKSLPTEEVIRNDKISHAAIFRSAQQFTPARQRDHEGRASGGRGRPAGGPVRPRYRHRLDRSAEVYLVRGDGDPAADRTQPADELALSHPQRPRARGRARVGGDHRGGAHRGPARMAAHLGGRQPDRGAVVPQHAEPAVHHARGHRRRRVPRAIRPPRPVPAQGPGANRRLAVDAGRVPWRREVAGPYSWQPILTGWVGARCPCRWLWLPHGHGASRGRKKARRWWMENGLNLVPRC